MEAPDCKITSPKGIEICADLLSKGKVRKDIIQIITTDYKVSIGCIDKWIKQARPKAKELLKQAEEIRAREMDAAITDAVKDGLLSDTEIEIILCKIISGGVQIQEYIKGTPILRDVTPTEQTNAARAIYLKRGSNAPTKIAATNGKGEDVKNYKITLKLN